MVAPRKVRAGWGNSPPHEAGAGTSRARPGQQGEGRHESPPRLFRARAHASRLPHRRECARARGVGSTPAQDDDQERIRRGERARTGRAHRRTRSRCRADGERIRSVAMVSTIAIGVDGSPTAAKAVDMAVEVARRFGAKVVLVSALRDSTATSAGQAVDTVELDWASEPSARVRHTLATTESRLRQSGLDCSTLVDEGDPGDVSYDSRSSAEPTSWWLAARACSAGSSAASPIRSHTKRAAPSSS